MAAYYTLQVARRDWRLFQRYIRRHRLPEDLVTWELLAKSSPELEEVWKELYSILRDGGYTLWPTASNGVSSSPGQVRNDPLSRAARAREGHGVIIRVIVVKEEGHKHIRILRKIATGEVSLCSDNHTLPLFGELELEDIIFGIFPKVNGIVKGADGTWATNSVGDIIDMLMQMLEALVFIHRMNIAHCDAFCDNFAIQWQPESLKKMKNSPCRPRVYLTNFEYAVEFSPDWPARHRILRGPPQKNSFRNDKPYTRPAPTEVTSLRLYNPFKLDVWQVGNAFSNITTTIGPIDAILMRMVADTAVRESAQKTLDRLTTVVHSMTAESLLFPPITLTN
ncbi:hypothetical protein BDZ94DRAFT_1280257 [Collybia nuda]|uniref:Protein kinase domain-containing protein n=1 Tax=Collybia nuda TaxID=64659 RepID=A0A9P6CP47_9AGAR|nr:hypothetical protein BDZ94DRAFT_1280257 [Collybia nuda]